VLVAFQTAPADPPAFDSATTPACGTAGLTDIMAVYLSVPPPKEAAAPIPSGVSSYLSTLLQHRLAACQSRVAASDGRPCVPDTAENNVPKLLWTHLQFCTLLVDPPRAKPAGIPWELPSLEGSGYQRVIFVIGTGGDPAVLAKLVSTLTVYLNGGRNSAGYHFVDDAVLVPEPTWTTDTFKTQCETSPSVDGAIVVNVTASGNGASDEFVSRRNWTAIEATAMYAQCAHENAATPGGTPAFVWASNVDQVEAHHSTFTPLLPLSLLLTLGSIYEEFAPQRASQVTSKKLFAPPTPLPKTGYRSEVDTADTTTINAAQVGSIAAGFLTSSIAYTNSAAPLTPGPALDQQTWNALQSVAIKLIGDMNCWQATPEPIGARSATDVLGPARSLPGYRPPVGLGASFRAGRPSAPFCSESAFAQSVRIVSPSTSPSPPR
jgi:hypothetical protein